MRHRVPDDLPIDLDAGAGLSAAQAAAQRAACGPNNVIEAAEDGWREVMRDTARDPMIWFLVGTAALFALLGDYAESAVLALALLPILGMDAWLHRRTRASTAGLSSRLATHMRVIRDGTQMKLATADLVPGDLAIVSASEYLPADDIRFEIDDACWGAAGMRLLTGEL